MSVNTKHLAETVLIDLSFALAEIAISGVKTQYILRATDHIQKAMASLKRLEPERDDKNRNHYSQTKIS